MTLRAAYTRVRNYVPNTPASLPTATWRHPRESAARSPCVSSVLRQEASKELVPSVVTAWVSNPLLTHPAWTCCPRAAATERASASTTEDGPPRTAVNTATCAPTSSLNLDRMTAASMKANCTSKETRGTRHVTPRVLARTPSTDIIDVLTAARATTTFHRHVQR
ncbi:hypothetical protein DPMN_173137 [Dreissena polymorpha]|uniref:Uncharacterized protein n=1 Tax=Dreissena polymorpha TaxID=45954 RepID=A0A9D4E2V7_DREPO|nr:hypothetical protein DPMN_173137 [Dreissena polymorpha]